MKATILAVSVLCLFLCTGISSCEQKEMDLAGVHAVYDKDGNLVKEKDGTPMVVIEPDSPAKKALDRASGATGPIGLIISLAGGLLLTGGQELLKRKLKNDLAKEEADHAATKADLASTTTTLNATTSGMASFAKANPTMAAPLVEHIDLSHDAHDVDPAHQDAIQSAIAA